MGAAAEADLRRGLARQTGALSTLGNGEAQAVDLGFFTEPPDGIEPSTYALRVCGPALVHPLVLVPDTV